MTTNTKTTKSYKECRRCAGTGDWAPGRVCFACGGRGRTLVWTTAMRIEFMKAHVAELNDTIARNRRALEAPRVLGRSILEQRVAAAEVALEKAQSEIAALEAAS